MRIQVHSPANRTRWAQAPLRASTARASKPIVLHRESGAGATVIINPLLGQRVGGDCASTGVATTAAGTRCSRMRGTGIAVYWRLILQGLEAFIEDGALSRGAAIAFYGVTAIAPTLFIAVAVA